MRRVENGGDCGLGHGRDGLADDREAWPAVLGLAGAVEADDGNVLGHLDAGFVKGSEDPDGLQVGDGEHRVREPACDQLQPHLMATLPAEVPFKCGPLGATALRECVLPALFAAVGFDVVEWAGSEGNRTRLVHVQ